MADEVTERERSLMTSIAKAVRDHIENLVGPVFAEHKHRQERHAEHLARLETRVAALERDRKS